MQIEKSKIIIIIIFCFVGASVITFLLKSKSNAPKDQTTNKATKHELQESEARQNQPAPQNKEALNTIKKDPETQYDNIGDLEALSGELIEGDIGDVMDKIWSSREITCDFSNRERTAEVIGQFPIISDFTVSEEQTELLRNGVTEMIFDNGNSDYDSYLNFMKNSGEIVHQSMIENWRSFLIDKAIPENDIPTDPWELLSKYLKERKRRSLWKGLVSEGSRIKIFEAQTSKLPIGKKLKELRRAIRTYHDLTAPPISLEEMLTKNGKVLMADVMFFIAHDDSTGGTVWPYTIRYWFDPVNNSWRVQKLALFRNRHQMWSIYVLP